MNKMESKKQYVIYLPQRNNLYFYHELDLWQQDNHFIRSAYVKHTSSYKKCLESMTYLHNETVNIYSHLMPAALTAIILFLYVIYWSASTPAWIRLSYFLFGIGAYTCLTLSALFHLFKSHSPRVCGFGNQCDYFGIVVMITFSLISVVMFVFEEVPQWRNSLVVIFMTLGSVCTIMTFDKKFSTPLYRPLRSFVFVIYGLSGVIPVIIAANVFGKIDAFHRLSAQWLILEGLFYIVGAFLYAARIPERFCHTEETRCKKVPGKFDIFGHLHQIFHIMVLIAAACHLKALSNCHVHWQSRKSYDT
ncbi:HlyIII-domain-containing protein [Metschnikowia bicuspidata var. bicuspidata NRRL YB-4993]|uniref:HlyIII-domain-containing protein n=1 Tax=Metschnikowia bicuspidata var. bicuspidata NRRL YB-4993 TaxID=869754 RepID=A0A1A0H965_9ASCO|nr:HlyIII-domain-containing protein [Metschnikowia bicuspidata var. bicuspidata NRRL YB-4993]OBA20551.1 HlyIII-domain-containing protein [Metschnikowia bicuspidata var. bicuspidata NRRL YB-4993]